MEFSYIVPFIFIGVFSFELAVQMKNYLAATKPRKEMKNEKLAIIGLCLFIVGYTMNISIALGMFEATIFTSNSTVILAFIGLIVFFLAKFRMKQQSKQMQFIKM